jgi:hypothetical protein
MKRAVAILILLCGFPVQAAPQNDPRWDGASVRIPSHGVTATVIHTERGLTYLLGCSHAFDPRPVEWEQLQNAKEWWYGFLNGDLIACYNGRTKQFHWKVGKAWTYAMPFPAGGIAPKDMLKERMRLDLPTYGWHGIRVGYEAKLLHRDPKLDLALIQINDGPAPYVCHVAGKSYVPGKHFISVGYDEMKTPAKLCRATVLGSTAVVNIVYPPPAHRGPVTDLETTFTVEPPWHGRSGGALIDTDAGLLVGVCGAYDGDTEHAKAGDARGGPGIYTSHRAIQRFLQQCGWHTK